LLFFKHWTFEPMQMRSPQLNFPPTARLFLGTLALALGLTPSLVWGQTPTTTIQNGNGNTRLQLNYNGSLLAPGTFINDGTENDSIPATGAGTRMMWYPAKAAFRAGRVGAVKDGSQWDATKVGRSSVAFGVDTKASSYATMAMGVETSASGYAATAMGDKATATGYAATATGNETAASGIAATAMGNNTTAVNDQSLSIGRYNSANTSADGTLLAAGNGEFDSRSDALVLKQNGDLAVGHSNPTSRLHAKDNVSGSASNPSNHVGFVENTGGTNSDGLAIKAGPNDNPGSAVNYLTFYDGDGDPIGAIEGDGSGGITQVSGSGDFAEELPVEEGTELPEPAEIVGVEGGEVRLETSGADRVMIASRAPILTGNATPATSADDNERVAVAFVGQVPAKVRGSVDVGDLIVPSGKADGTAQAVAPEEYRRAEHGPIAGQAWSPKASEQVGEVTVAVGLGRSGAVAERMEDQRDRIAELEAENEALKTQQQEIKNRLAALEAERSPSALAGLAGSGTGLLLTFLLGGLLGAGLLWRRRA
jgi:hypothetical protein